MTDRGHLRAAARRLPGRARVRAAWACATRASSSATIRWRGSPRTTSGRPTAPLKVIDDPTRSLYRQASLLPGWWDGIHALDYHRFTRMLLKGGDERRATARAEDRRQMTPTICPATGLSQLGLPGFQGDTLRRHRLRARLIGDSSPATANSSRGPYAWGGAASTAFWIDPVEELIVIFMTQLLPSSSYPLTRELRVLSYASLID